MRRVRGKGVGELLNRDKERGIAFFASRTPSLFMPTTSASKSRLLHRIYCVTVLNLSFQRFVLHINPLRSVRLMNVMFENSVKIAQLSNITTSVNL